MVNLSCGALARRSLLASAICGSVAHLFQHLLRPFDQLGDVGILQRVLKAAAAGAGANIDVLRRLQKDGGALHLGEFRPQAVV